MGSTAVSITLAPPALEAFRTAYNEEDSVVKGMQRMGSVIGAVTDRLNRDHKFPESDVTVTGNVDGFTGMHFVPFPLSGETVRLRFAGVWRLDQRYQILYSSIWVGPLGLGICGIVGELSGTDDWLITEMAIGVRSRIMRGPDLAG